MRALYNNFWIIGCSVRISIMYSLEKWGDAERLLDVLAFAQSAKE